MALVVAARRIFQKTDKKNKLRRGVCPPLVGEVGLSRFQRRPRVEELSKTGRADQSCSGVTGGVVDSPGWVPSSKAVAATFPPVTSTTVVPSKLSVSAP